MRKVVVDLELLERLRNFTFLHDDGCAGALRGGIDRAIAQPAEAEGPERWSELRALAESAPGKNWKAGNAYGKPFIPTYQVIADTVDGPCVILEGNKNFIEQAEAAATFAAAANPSAVLELLAALSAVTAERDRLRKDAERYRWASSGVHEAETLVSIVNCHGGYAEKVAERVDVYREAAMAAKEA